MKRGKVKLEFSAIEYGKVAARLNAARLWSSGIDERPMKEVIPDVHQHGRDQDIAIECLRNVIRLMNKFRSDCRDCGKYINGRNQYCGGCEKECAHYQFHMAFDPYFLENKKGSYKNGKQKK